MCCDPTPYFKYTLVLLNMVEFMKSRKYAK